MAERRPGGLTALAVFNFIFAGFGTLGLLALFALLKLSDASSDELNAALEGEGLSAGLIYLSIALNLVSIALLIAAGVGYLGQKRVLGRTLGNVYAILAIVSSIVFIVLLEQGVGISTIIGLIYPVLTLALLNTTFKDDLVR